MKVSTLTKYTDLIAINIKTKTTSTGHKEKNKNNTHGYEAIN